MTMKGLLGILMTVLLANALTVWARDVVVRDGNREWRFAEVNGTSRLPLEFMRTGVDLGRKEEVTLPTYWIAEKLVTEREFAEMMRRPVRPGRDADGPATDIEWADAEAFCRRFTKKFASRLPDNTVASLPTMIEWAHAVLVLEDRVDLAGETGTFLFTGSQTGGYLHTLWRDVLSVGKDQKASETFAMRHAEMSKRGHMDGVGIRLVLVDATQEMQGFHPLVTRGVVALQHGEYEAAESYLETALAQRDLSAEARKQAREALDVARAPHDDDLEDWSGLVAVSFAFAAGQGFETEPYASGWQKRSYRQMKDKSIALAYRTSGIDGGWLPIRDLPRELRADQAADVSNVVQVVVCDFTGDGKKDLVVERFGAAGSFGFWYDFYARQTNGVYTHVHALQTAGLCVLPRKSDGGCGFLTVEKCANPVLMVSLLSWSQEKMASVPVHGRPFCMLDAQSDRLYPAAPFIGGGLGLGWRILEERGHWYRPLYWPWKPGRAMAR